MLSLKYLIFNFDNESHEPTSDQSKLKTDKPFDTSLSKIALSMLSDLMFDIFFFKKAFRIN